MSAMRRVGRPSTGRARRDLHRQQRGHHGADRHAQQLGHEAGLRQRDRHFVGRAARAAGVARVGPDVERAGHARRSRNVAEAGTMKVPTSFLPGPSPTRSRTTWASRRRPSACHEAFTEALGSLSTASCVGAAGARRAVELPRARALLAGAQHPQADEHHGRHHDDHRQDSVLVHASDSAGQAPLGVGRRRRQLRKGWSGCRDSNPGPPAPQAGALARLRYIPFEPFYSRRRRVTAVPRRDFAAGAPLAVGAASATAHWRRAVPRRRLALQPLQRPRSRVPRPLVDDRSPDRRRDAVFRGGRPRDGDGRRQASPFDVYQLPDSQDALDVRAAGKSGGLRPWPGRDQGTPPPRSAALKAAADDSGRRQRP